MEIKLIHYFYCKNIITILLYYIIILMTTILEYTSHVARLSHFKEYILANHQVTINYIITDNGANNQNNSIIIEFDSVLDQSTINSINSSVNSYTNPTDPIIDFSTFFPLQHLKIKSTTYTKVACFNFNPSIGNLCIIKINSNKNSTETFSYSLRIIDVNNDTIIQEQTGLNNQQEENIVFNSLVNLPTSNSVFEIHAKLDTENTIGILVNCFELIYCQI